MQIFDKPKLLLQECESLQKFELWGEWDSKRLSVCPLLLWQEAVESEIKSRPLKTAKSMLVPSSPHHSGHVCRLQSRVPWPNGDTEPLTTTLQRLHPGGTLFLGVSCHDLTFNDGSATLLAKYCLLILYTFLRATLGHPLPASCDPGHPPNLSWKCVLCVWGTQGA